MGCFILRPPAPPGLDDDTSKAHPEAFSLEQTSLSLVRFPFLPWLPRSSALHQGPTSRSLCLLPNPALPSEVDFTFPPPICLP